MSGYDKNDFIENVMQYPDVSKEIAGRLYKKLWMQSPDNSAGAGKQR